MGKSFRVESTFAREFRDRARRESESLFQEIFDDVPFIGVTMENMPRKGSQHFLVLYVVEIAPGNQKK